MLEVLQCWMFMQSPILCRVPKYCSVASRRLPWLAPKASHVFEFTSNPSRAYSLCTCRRRRPIEYKQRVSTIVPFAGDPLTRPPPTNGFHHRFCKNPLPPNMPTTNHYRSPVSPLPPPHSTSLFSRTNVTGSDKLTSYISNPSSSTPSSTRR